MGSTARPSFFSRLLRPDRKENSPAPRKKDARKRHSAPVPSWFDPTDPVHILAPSSTSAPSKSQQRQKTEYSEVKQEQNSRSANKANRNKVKNKSENKKSRHNQPKENMKNDAFKQKNTAVKSNKTKKENKDLEKESSSKKVAKKHSSGLAYWFCVSDSADKLPAEKKKPFSKSVENRSDKLASIPEAEAQGNHTDVPNAASLAGVIRRDKKKRRDKTQNRHSAPPETLAVFRAKEIPSTSNHSHGSPSHASEFDMRAAAPKRPVSEAFRSSSPGVRYRVDGTLERPYVFPSGLTFGAEGRKTKLRSRTMSQELESPCQSSCDLNTSTVVVDVHRTSRADERQTKQVKRQYIHTSNPNIADVSYDDFDVRKAFYLKFDGGDVQSHADVENDTRKHRQSVPVFAATFETVEKGRGLGHEMLHSTDVDSQRFMYATGRQQQRYSMPPKNEEFVYMGSRENLSLWSDFLVDQEITKADTDTPFQNGGDQRSQLESRRRYSSPVHNTDCVYMGSVENIHLLNAEDKRAGCLSLKRDTDAFFLTGSGAMPALSATDNFMEVNQETRSRGRSLSEQMSYCPSGFETVDVMIHNHNEQEISAIPSRSKQETKVIEEHHQSMPDLTLTRKQNLTRTRNSESNAVDCEVVTSDGEHFTGATDARFSRTPFSRNLGRASCMPGNKKQFILPPAIFSQSDTTVQLVGTVDDCKKISPAGMKRFRFPPPPNYTPPREEMEDAQAQLSKLAMTNKGSQTNLDNEALYCVNMEDRDLSLPRSNAKTKYPSPSSSTKTFSFTNVKENELESPLKPEEIKNDNKIEGQGVGPKQLLDVSITSSEGSDSVFKEGSGSESAWLSHRFDFARRKKYALPGVTPKQSTLKAQPSENIKAKEDETNHSDLNKPFKNTENVVTSTPKVARRDTTETNRSLTPNGTKGYRPVPTPRKRNSSLGLSGFDPGSLINDMSKKNIEERAKIATTDVPPYSHVTPQQENTIGSSSEERKTPPVPKKRNLTKGRSLSEISTSHCVSLFTNAISEERFGHPRQDDNDKFKTNVNSHFPNVKPQIGPRDMLSSNPSATDNSKGNSREQWNNFDDTCIADDEMSCCEDRSKENRDLGSSEMKQKRRSLRKCVSEDDLLHSGNILDRSLILARRKKRRMRERKCRSYMQLSSSEDEDETGAGDNVPLWRRKSGTQRKHTTDAEFDNRIYSQEKPDQFGESVNRYSALADSTRHPLKQDFLGNDANFHRLDKEPRNFANSHTGGLAGASLPQLLKPWEIGLQNMGTASKVSPVARGSEGFFTATSQQEPSSNSGRETVV
ncbi:hypothetical protein PoB_006626100 [Plakobranchus ocellatus]|uniref:Uncharacterized protein n=1 Tax=Plakobranchus ocellatus TaxID=259542 RepID=A0AAV4D6S6_9GAST|nr:hypothetical protein PoB_006626100 [Plakobranchus ocellatus]